jgi:hypothetical protein
MHGEWWNRRDEIVSRYWKGETIEVLAADLGVSIGTLYKALREWKGAKRRGHSASAQSIRVPVSARHRGYLAGLVDGEGSVSIHLQRKRQRPTVAISVGSTTRELHDWLLTEVGGTSYERKIRHLGKKTMWYWHVVRARDIEALLEAIIPYMIIKRERAIAALEVVRDSISFRSAI